MKRSKLRSASIMTSVIIMVISAFSMFGLALGQESGSSEGSGEHRTTSSEGGSRDKSAADSAFCSGGDAHAEGDPPGHRRVVGTNDSDRSAARAPVMPAIPATDQPLAAWRPQAASDNSKAGAGKSIQTSVEDKGAGIDPADLPYIFHRFFRAVQSGSGGRGLGLDIARTITEAHGGSISVHSEGLGCGTTVRILLPVDGKSAGDKV